MSRKGIGIAVINTTVAIMIGIALTVFLSTYQRNVKEFCLSDESSKSAYDSFNEHMFKYALLAYLLHIITSFLIALGAHQQRTFYAAAAINNVFTMAVLILISSAYSTANKHLQCDNSERKTGTSDVKSEFAVCLFIATLSLELLLVIAYLYAILSDQNTSMPNHSAEHSSK